MSTQRLSVAANHCDAHRKYPVGHHCRQIFRCKPYATHASAIPPIGGNPMSETPQSASQAFFSGCKSGLNLALYGILPRVMVAFIFISVLEACGAMSLIGDIFTPLMHVWSLPGEAAVVLATAILSNAAAVGTIVSLFASGTLSAADATILMPGLYLMGALFQFAARVLGTAGVSRKIWPAMFAICLVNSAAAMWITAWLVR